jgi:hypothetical protein
VGRALPSGSLSAVRPLSDEGERRPPRGPTSERGVESQGAMRNYFKEQNAAAGTASTTTAWGDIIGTVKATSAASSGAANSLAGKDFSRETSGRAFNSSRGGPAKKKRNFTPSAATTTGGAGGAAGGRYEGTGGMANVFGRKSDGYDEDEEGGKDDDKDIPPEVAAYLFDTPFFEEKLNKGLNMDFGDMDPVDKFFADCFMESFKHNDHEVSYHLEKEGNSRIRLPQPRPTRDLVASLIPNITSVSRTEDTKAHLLGSEAWQAISKNIYFSDQEKSYMCNKIAKDAKTVYDGVARLEQDHTELDELRIFSADFRKGYDGLTLEQRRELFGDEEGYEGKTEIDELEAHLDGEDLTDYNVEAFVDEDELFK